MRYHAWSATVKRHVRVVQQILGHSQVSQTERSTHVTAQLGTDAAQRMAAALSDRPRTNCN
jgi:integrase